MTQPHTHGPDDMPEALCRKCHPELNRTTTQRAQLVRAERAQVDSAMQRSSLLRALGKAQQALGQAERKIARGGGAQGIGVKLAKSARGRIAKLEAELATIA